MKVALRRVQVDSRNGLDTLDEINTMRIRSEAETIEENIERVTQARKECSRIETAIDDIRGELGVIEDGIEKRLTELEGELAAAE